MGGLEGCGVEALFLFSCSGGPGCSVADRQVRSHQAGSEVDHALTELNARDGPSTEAGRLSTSLPPRTGQAQLTNPLVVDGLYCLDYYIEQQDLRQGVIVRNKTLALDPG